MEVEILEVEILEVEILEVEMADWQIYFPQAFPCTPDSDELVPPRPVQTQQRMHHQCFIAMQNHKT